MSNDYEWFYRQQVQQQHGHLALSQYYLEQQQQLMNHGADVTISSHHSFIPPSTCLSPSVLLVDEIRANDNRCEENGVSRDVTSTNRRVQELKCRNSGYPEQRCMPVSYVYPSYNAALIPSSMYTPPTTPFFESPPTTRSCTVDNPLRALPNGLQPPWCCYSGAPNRSQFDVISRGDVSISTPSYQHVVGPSSLRRFTGGESAQCTTSAVGSRRLHSNAERSDVLITETTDRRRLVAAGNQRYGASYFTSAPDAVSPIGIGSDFAIRSSLEQPLPKSSLSRAPQWPSCILQNNSITSICSSSGDRNASSTAAASGPRSRVRGRSPTRTSNFINNVSRLASDETSAEPQLSSVGGVLVDDESLVDTAPTPVDISTLLQAVQSAAHRCSGQAPTAPPSCGIRSSSRRERGGRLLHDPEAVKALRAWYDANKPNTVADLRTLEQLAKLTGMTLVQVRKWLYNMRYRSGQTKKHQL